MNYVCHSLLVCEGLLKHTPHTSQSLSVCTSSLPVHHNPLLQGECEASRPDGDFVLGVAGGQVSLWARGVLDMHNVLAQEAVVSLHWGQSTRLCLSAWLYVVYPEIRAGYVGVSLMSLEFVRVDRENTDPSHVEKYEKYVLAYAGRGGVCSYLSSWSLIMSGSLCTRSCSNYQRVASNFVDNECVVL